MKKKTATKVEKQKPDTSIVLSPDSSEILPGFDAGNMLSHLFDQADTDLRAWAQLYLSLQVKGIKSPETIRQTKNDLTDFARFFDSYFHCFDLFKWTPQATKRYIEDLQGLGRKPATISRRLISIRAFGKWVLSHRPDLFPLGDPTNNVKPPVQDAIRPKCLTDRQIKAVLDVASQRITLRENHPTGRKIDLRPRRDFAIIMLLLNGGLRRSEICDLDLDHLQGKKLVNVKCKGNFFRNITLGKETVLALAKYIEIERDLDSEFFTDSPALFLPTHTKLRRGYSGRLASRTINAIVKKLLSKVNEDLSKTNESIDPADFHPHAFRHTHAYKLIAKSDIAQVQKRLGHKRPDLVVLYAQMPESEEMDLINEVEQS